MKFGFINLCGAIAVAVMLIPNIVYALKYRDEKNLCTNKAMNVAEQIGRFGCIILMWLPLLVWKFGFASVPEALVYFAGNASLLIAYLAVFGVYFRKKTKGRAIALAVLPACIFLLSGLTLRHWLLVGFAALFAVGHIYVTVKNAEASASEGEDHVHEHSFK